MRKSGLLGTVGAVVLAGSMGLSAYAVDAEDMIGQWSAFSIMASESGAPNPIPDGMSELKLELAKDGSARAVVSLENAADIVVNGTWTLENDLVVVDGIHTTPITFHPYGDDNNDNNMLASETDGWYSFFKKETVETNVSYPGEIVAEPQMEDFDGEWKAAVVERSGEQMSASDAGIEMNLLIKDGKAELFYKDDEKEKDIQLEGTLEGDTLTLKNLETGEEKESEEDSFDTEILTLCLHENGVMSYSDKDFSGEETAESGFAVYFEKTVEVFDDASTVQQVQEKLNEEGFDCGTPDGAAGPKTEEAIRAFQASRNLTTDGKISRELLEALGLMEKETEPAAETGETIEDSYDETRDGNQGTDDEKYYTPGKDLVLFEVNGAKVILKGDQSEVEELSKDYQEVFRDYQDPRYIRLVVEVINDSAKELYIAYGIDLDGNAFEFPLNFGPDGVSNTGFELCEVPAYDSKKAVLFAASKEPVDSLADIPDLQLYFEAYFDYETAGE